MANVINVARSYIDVRFDVSLKASSVSTDKFSLFVVDGEVETEVTDPFKQIVMSDHYSSISRTLRLFFVDSDSLDVGEYKVVATGLIDAFSRPLANIEVLYTYEYENAVEPDPPYDKEEWEPTLDFSIKAHPFVSSEIINAANQDFYITKTDPGLGEIFVDPKYKKGVITVHFSTSPSLLLVNDEYIKVQRKKLGFPISRWENLDARIKLDSSQPKVYISIPSIETELTIDGETITEPPGQYEVEGLDYFEPQYKYRVKISGEFGANAA